MDRQQTQRRRVVEPYAGAETSRRRPAADPPAGPRAPSLRQRIRQQLATPQQIRESLLLAEILGRPKGL